MLGGDRQTLQRLAGPQPELRAPRQDEKAALGRFGSQPIGELEPITAHRFESQTQLRLELSQLRPPEQRDFSEYPLIDGFDNLVVTLCHLAAEVVDDIRKHP